jgi:hypothetical protein
MITTLFGTKKQISKTNSRKPSPLQGRRLQIEPLEERQMLAITPADFNAIKAAYPDLNLTNAEDYNVIQVAADQLSDNNLRTAISLTTLSPGNDLIVFHTTDTQNTITLDGFQLDINVNAGTLGSVTIVSWGDEKLTIDADQRSRVFNIGAGSDVGLAGLTITNGYVSGDGAGI